jgi:hypothetical protein
LVLGLVAGGVRAQVDRPTVEVGTVSDLYTEINKASNAGAIVHVAAGVYQLDPKAPNGGRLWLQPGMDLIGDTAMVDADGDGIPDPYGADPSALPAIGAAFAVPGTGTILDASALTGTSGVVRLGQGDNLVRGIVVYNAINAGSCFDLTFPDTAGNIRGRVTDSMCDGSMRGIRVGRGGLAQPSFATIERNVLRRAGPSFGFGIQIQNGAGNGQQIVATITGNRVYGNRIGLFVVGSNSTNVSNTVTSTRNLFQANQVGMVVLASFIGGPANHCAFTSQEDRIEDNVEDASGGFQLKTSDATPPRSLGGGLVAGAGVQDSATLGVPPGNQLDLHLLGTRFARNTRRGADGSTGHPGDLAVFGALGAGTTLPAGSGNVTKLWMCSARSDAAAAARSVVDSDPVQSPAPATEADANHVNILASGLDLSDGQGAALAGVPACPPLIVFGAPAPEANGAGWNNGEVVVPFTAVADRVAAVASDDLGADNRSLVLRTEGASVHGIVTATDVAGNVEQYVSPAVSIDFSAPAVTVEASPGVVSPPEHKELAVTFRVTVRDLLSGVGAIASAVVSSSAPMPGFPMALDPASPSLTGQGATGVVTQTLLLPAKPPHGTKDLVYTLSVTALDQAGNPGAGTGQVTLLHDNGEDDEAR